MSRRHVAAVLVVVALARPLGAGATTGDPFPNQVLQLTQNGQPAWATVDDNPHLRPPGALSVECWVKADASQPLTPYPIILTKPAGNLLNGECSYGFIADRATGHLHFRITTTTGNFDVMWSGNVLDGKWHHLAGTRGTGGAAQISLMVDGLMVAGAVITGNTLYSSEPLCIGAAQFTGYLGNHLAGQVDEVRLWNVQRGSNLVYYDRLAVENALPGLAEVWHFDRPYPDMWGNPLLLDAVNADVMTLHAAGFAAGSSPLVRSLAATVVDVVGQGTTGPTTFRSAVRLSGARDLVYRTRVQPGSWNPYGWDELNVVTLGNVGLGSRVLGTLQMIPGRPLLNLAARDSVVFGIRVDPGFSAVDWLRAIDVRTSQPAFAGDSLQVLGNVKVLIDPASPNRLVVAGCDGPLGDNHLSFVDATNPFAPVLLYDTNVGTQTGFDLLVDVAKRGAYVYTSYSDGTLRIHRYDEFMLNGHLIRGLSPVGSTLSLGARSSLAIGGSVLFAGGDDGTLRAYDVTSPAAPVLVGTRSEPRSIAAELIVDGTRLAVLGPNGVEVLDVHDPTSFGAIAYYCADMPGGDAPRASFRDGVCGLAAGIGDYTLLRFDGATLGVDPGSPRPVMPALTLTPSPNPARGAVSFSAPGLAGAADLTIFDTAGRCIRTTRVQASQVRWDTRDESGRPVAAGLYLARLHDDHGGVRIGRVAVVR